MSELKLEEALELLKATLSGVECLIGEESGIPTVRATPENLSKAAERLKEAGFDHVKSVTGIDYPEEGSMEVVYHISSYTKPELAKLIVALKTKVERGSPKLSSLYRIWPSSAYLESETYDLMGIEFDGNPKQRRLLLPEDYEGIPPLRKDFKIPVEEVDAVE